MFLPATAVMSRMGLIRGGPGDTGKRGGVGDGDRDRETEDGGRSRSWQSRRGADTETGSEEIKVEG